MEYYKNKRVEAKTRYISANVSIIRLSKMIIIYQYIVKCMEYKFLYIK